MSASGREHTTKTYTAINRPVFLLLLPNIFYIKAYTILNNWTPQVQNTPYLTKHTPYITNKHMLFPYSCFPNHKTTPKLNPSSLANGRLLWHLGVNDCHIYTLTRVQMCPTGDHGPWPRLTAGWWISAQWISTHFLVQKGPLLTPLTVKNGLPVGFFSVITLDSTNIF